MIRQDDFKSHPARFNSLVAGVGFEPMTSGPRTETAGMTTPPVFLFPDQKGSQE